MTATSGLRRSFPSVRYLAAPFRWAVRTRRRALTVAAVLLAMLAAPPLWWWMQLLRPARHRRPVRRAGVPVVHDPRRSQRVHPVSASVGSARPAGSCVRIAGCAGPGRVADRIRHVHGEEPARLVRRADRPVRALVKGRSENATLGRGESRGAGTLSAGRRAARCVQPGTERPGEPPHSVRVAGLASVPLVGLAGSVAAGGAGRDGRGLGLVSDGPAGLAPLRPARDRNAPVRRCLLARRDPDPVDGLVVRPADDPSNGATAHSTT